jgi:hypothetical protein
VSKLCCPACCKLFQSLLKAIFHDNEQLELQPPAILTQFHGCHSVPYPVKLPKWLPEDVNKVMVAFFMPVLVDALEGLMHESPPAHPVPAGKVHRSQQSNSNISIDSSNAEVTYNPVLVDQFNAQLDEVNKAMSGPASASVSLG